MNANPSPSLQPFGTTRKTSEKTGHSWSTHDRACTHCRERKIRCGREKPQCANCERDGVECGYYPPGKRVNHIKLLCNNVGSVEDRLCCIEGELARLTTLLKADGIQRPMNVSAAAETSSTQTYSPGCQHSTQDSFVSPTNRHIVRSRSNDTDHYHGPCTLFGLCKELSDLLLSETSGLDIMPVDGAKTARISQERETIKDVLSRICLDAARDEPFSIQADYGPVRLPAKQFLMMVITQFFEQVDYSTDIFVQSSFTNHVERIYDQNFAAYDEAWAVCFNTIILLVLGAESSIQGNDLLLGPQFTQPFLFAVRTALSNPQVLMTPNLVNMQALTLLSVAAQLYCSPKIASSIFAQACVLAKTMGLHQLHVVSDTLDREEAVERFKVIRSLYLRDKSHSLSQGSICWLPTMDCPLPLETGRNMLDDAEYRPRIQLAALQEQIYRLLYSAESFREPMMSRKLELLRIEKCLEQWADANRIFTSHSLDTDLTLEFLATRICAFRESPEPSHIHQALADARRSCLLLLVSYGKLEQSAVSQFEEFPIPKTPSKSLAKEVNSRPRKGGASDSGPTDDIRNEGRYVSIKFYSLLETFSAPGFVLLVKNAIMTSSDSDNSQTEKDFELLEGVCACYAELSGTSLTEAYISKVGRAFSGLLQVVNLLRFQPEAHLSPDAAQQTGGTHTSPETPNMVRKHQNFVELADAPGPSAYLTPSISQPSLGSNVPLMTAPETTSRATSPIMLTSMEPEYVGQWYDPARQHPFPPFAQHPPAPAPSRKRPRLNEPDSTVDPDPNSLSEFLNTTGMMPF